MMDNQNNNTDEAKSKHEIAEYYEGIKNLELKRYEDGVQKARNMLFVTAGLLLLAEIMLLSRPGTTFSPLIIGFIIIEVGSFIALAFWTRTKPFTAVITGLILYLLLWVMAVVLNGEPAIYKGFWVRIIIIVALISTIKPAKAWEDAKNGLK